MLFYFHKAQPVEHFIIFLIAWTFLQFFSVLRYFYFSVYHLNLLV